MVRKGRASYDVLIAIDRFGSRSAGLARELRPLARLFDGSNLLGTDVFHRNRADCALLVLHIERRSVTGSLLRGLVDACVQASLQHVLLDRLGEEERASFRESHLRQYEVAIEGLPDPVDALAVLADRLGVSDPYTDMSIAPTTRAPVDVRYQRQDRWHSGQVCRLSVSGAYIATMALPRCGEIVELELRQGPKCLVIPAQVVQVTSPRAAHALGTTGFGARLLPAREDQNHLVKMVAEVGEAFLSRRPKRRRDVRYPIQWPGWVEADGRRRRATVLNVSRRGAFVGGLLDFLPGTSMKLRLPLEANGEAVVAHGRVVRNAKSATAKGRVGLGLELEQSDEFDHFVGQVSCRVSRHVVVGSSAPSLRTVMDALAGAGYSATGASEPREVMRLVLGDEPPDLVVVDTSMCEQYRRGVSILRSKLGDRSVDFVEVSLRDRTRVRELVDSVLSSRKRSDTIA